MLLLPALGAAPAAPEEASALATRAAEQCKAGDLDGASASLRRLLAQLESSLGPAADATQIVRLNLAHLAHARGDAAEAARLEQPAEGRGKGARDAALERSLKGLRACAAPVARAPAAAMPKIESTDQVNLARNMLNRGRYREALAMATDAVKSATADEQAEQRMRLYETLALIQLQLGHPDDALAAAARAEAIARQLGDVELRITLARLAAQVGDLDGASQRLAELAGEARTAELRAEFDEAEGDVDLRLGSPRSALEHLERALAGHRKVYGEQSAPTAAVLHLRGDAFRLAGDFPAARDAYRGALAIRQKVLGPGHAETARTLNALGVLQADLGDWAAADRYFADAQSKLEAALGASHPEVLTVRANRALARWGAARSAEAAAGYGQVVEALGKALGEDHPSVAAALRNQARMMLDLGQLDRSAELLERGLAAQTRSLGPSHPALAPTWLARARLRARRGELDGAGADAQRALDVLVAANGPEHPVVIRARVLAARIAVARGDDAAAFEQARQASSALAHYTRRTFGALSDRQRGLLADDSQDVIGALLSAESAPPRDLFVALLPHRDSVLRSIAAGRASGAQAGELARLRQRYVAAVLGQGDAAARRSRELAQKIDELEAGGGAGAAAPERDPEQVLARACRRLPADAALIKFAAYDRTRAGAGIETTPGMAALVVRGGDCSVARVTLAGAADTSQAADAFAAAMRADRADEPEARAALGREVLEPLRGALAGTHRWLVEPDGALWGVPFAILPDPEAPDHYLFERVTVGYLTSTFELAEAAEPGRIDAPAQASLLVGAPDFGDGARGGPIVLTDSGPCQMPPFDELPATRSEVQDVATLVGAPAALTGADASKPRVEAALNQAPWLLHFATHAYFAGAEGCRTRKDHGAAWREGDAPVAPNPLLLSGIVLAGANDPARVGSQGQAGVLTAYEVAGLDLHSAGLVVLSACDTGTGLQVRGQEVQGLRWGFRAAGAHALVTSLWRSNDVATRSLMRAFYQALLSGEIPADAFRGAEALRRAQLAQMQSERRLGVSRPASWANFVFSGVL